MTFDYQFSRGNVLAVQYGCFVGVKICLLVLLLLYIIGMPTTWQQNASELSGNKGCLKINLHANVSRAFH